MDLEEKLRELLRRIEQGYLGSASWGPAAVRHDYSAAEIAQMIRDILPK